MIDISKRSTAMFLANRAHPLSQTLTKLNSGLQTARSGCRSLRNRKQTWIYPSIRFNRNEWELIFIHYTEQLLYKHFASLLHVCVDMYRIVSFEAYWGL